MTFKRADHDIEEWLSLEDSNLLQKICNLTDEDGNVVEQYKTRVFIVPVGSYIPTLPNAISKSAPALYRSFNYDDEGNRVASLPDIREWTSYCESIVQGADPAEIPSTGIPSGLKVARSFYDYDESLSVPAAATVALVSKTLLPDEAIYLRHSHFSGENIGKFQVLVNGSPLQTKRTWWTKFDGDFWFNTANGGILYDNEEVIEIKVTNLGVGVADFEASIGFTVK